MGKNKPSQAKPPSQVINHKDVQKKKKKKLGEPSMDDLALQELVDFIEGNDADKENVVTTSDTSKKSKKKKKKERPKTPQEVEAVKDVTKPAEPKVQALTKDSPKPVTNPSRPAQSQHGLKERDMNKPKIKTKQKVHKKKEPTQEELEIEQILKFIEGTSIDDADGNNNDSENGKKKSKKKKNKSKKKKSKSDSESDSDGLDFNAMGNSAVLTNQMLDFIVKNPPTVADYRIFDPKQVAMLFSRGHNEHWNNYPDCKGRLKALEKSTEGFTLYDPGCKQLKLIVDELKRKIRGRPITKADMVQGLQCHAYLQCPECGYTSDIVILNNV